VSLATRAQRGLLSLLRVKLTRMSNVRHAQDVLRNNIFMLFALAVLIQFARIALLTVSCAPARVTLAISVRLTLTSLPAVVLSAVPEVRTGQEVVSMAGSVFLVKPRVLIVLVLATAVLLVLIR
jgi:hypothetical protein